MSAGSANEIVQKIAQDLLELQKTYSNSFKKCNSKLSKSASLATAITNIRNSDQKSKNFLEIFNGVYDAFKSVGMSTFEFKSLTFPPDQSNTYPANILGGAPSNAVMAYVQRATFHAIQPWQLSFMTHLPLFYRSSYNESNRLQNVDYNWYLGQPSESSCSDENDNKTVIIVISVIMSFFIALSIGQGIYVYTLYKRLGSNNDSQKRPEVTFATHNPM